MSADPRITIADIRVLYCVKGAKKGFETAGLDFGKFIREGANASELRGHGYDAVIDRVVQSMQGHTDGR
ncbi:hypothetical protein [Mesorhizobium sp.]|uniref:hypothetical protein n=1 Tax=Mesorhizobium sp. TaxID=1871066 RepID=UPI000FE81981|nr:hypothetical protein [Mesorhizobium sp.]RWP69563.1 MAG: hypothetical protein EOR07_03290 [Mesorhizobium sp.]